MRCFNPAKSILAGRSTDKLQTDLDAAQTAFLALSSGTKGESFSYTQGDGAKSVTYTRGNLGDLVKLIELLQAQLGIVEPRRAVMPGF